MVWIVAGIFMVPVFVAGMIWRGYALSVLWGWFVVPFVGLPEMNIPTAIGIAALVGLTVMAQSPQSDGDEAWEKLVHGVMLIAAAPAVALLVGWIVKGFL